MESILEKKIITQIENQKDAYRKEIIQFKEIGHKFLNSEISRAEFKATSGGMGVYAQRDGKEFMLRLRILSGVLDIDTLKLIQTFTHDYKMDFIHFTTRQAIQLHNLQFDPLIEMMQRSLENNIITRGGGGNFPRNVSLSPLSGVEKEEPFDVTPYAVIVNKYFLSQMNTYHLPRKFKVAFSNNEQDSANATIADLGFLAVLKNGENYFQLYLGGGLGANAETAIIYDELIQPQDVLYHVEAMLSLFQAEGDYQNKGKARIRYIVKRMGKDSFITCYKKHLDDARSNQNLELILPQEEASILATDSVDELRDYTDVFCQKQEKLYSVDIHPQSGILKTLDLDKIINFLENLPNIELRLTMEESIVVRNLTAAQASELLTMTKDIRKSTRLSHSVSCIGVPICQIGVQESQKLLTDIIEYFNEKELTEDLLPSIYISGCVNSCTRHQANDIGFQGKKKRVDNVSKDAYALFIGGATRKDTAQLGKEYGDILACDIPEFLYQLALLLKANKQEFREYLRIHHDKFVELSNNFLI